MSPLELLKVSADLGWQEFRSSLEGVTERQAWATLPNLGPDYLHTDGTIYGLVLHIASVKWMYGSICFRNSEIRWRQVADEIEQFEPNWDEALRYVERGHAYWLESWRDLADIEELRPTNWGEERPAYRTIELMSRHDSYHAGQVAMLRYGVAESDGKPQSGAEDIRKHCQKSIAW